MTDILLRYNNTIQEFDIVLGNADVVTGNDLATLYFISLFSDRVQDTSWTPTQLDNNPRGWWADTYSQYLIGSKLYTLMNANSVDAVVTTKAIAYCTESCQWIIDQGITASHTFTAMMSQSGILNISVTAVEPTGQSSSISWDLNPQLSVVAH